VLIVAAQNAVAAPVLGVATSTVQLTRSLGGTVGVAMLGGYLAMRVADMVGGGSLTAPEISRVLAAETLVVESAGTVALREELAAAIRILFVAGAIMMAVATGIALRLRPNGGGDVAPRRLPEASA
jgi:hypothetical protein